MADTALETHLRARARRGTQAPRAVRHRRARRRLGRGGAGLRGRRCRCHRGRHPVLRSGDGRADDPGGLRGRPRPGHQPRRHPHRAARRRCRRAARRHDLREPRVPRRLRALRRRGGGRAASPGVILPDLPMEEAGRVAAPRRRGRSRHRAARVAAHARRSPGRAVRAVTGLRLRREPARRHRRARRAGRLVHGARQATEGRHRPAGA